VRWTTNNGNVQFVCSLKMQKTKPFGIMLGRLLCSKYGLEGIPKIKSKKERSGRHQPNKKKENKEGLHPFSFIFDVVLSFSYRIKKKEGEKIFSIPEG